MSGYILINLKDMITQIGEDTACAILSDFYCPQNSDIEAFLKQKSIEFAKQGLAATHLVFTSYQDSPVLIGYFTLANKIFFIGQAVLSKTMKKRIQKFSYQDPKVKGYFISAPLIAQLGKNYFNGYDKLISGDELVTCSHHFEKWGLPRMYQLTLI